MNEVHPKFRFGAINLAVSLAYKIMLINILYEIAYILNISKGPFIVFKDHIDTGYLQNNKI